MIIEKYFDLSETGIQHDINKYLANGWWIDFQGITCLIMKKEV